jgi:signal transduction histidine kinase
MGMNRTEGYWKYLFTGILLMSIVFAIEIYTQLLIGSVGYILIVLYTLWFLRTSDLQVPLGIVATFLIVLAGIVLWEEIAKKPALILEQAGSLLSIWFAIYITDRFRLLHAMHLAEVKNHNTALEEQVEQRTLELDSTNRALSQSQQLYQSMARYFPDGMIAVLDRNLNYVLIDGENLKHFGVDYPERIIGQPFHRLHPALSVQEPSLRKAFDGEGVSFDLELYPGYYQLSAVPLPGEDGGIRNILVVIKNISHRKEMEANLMNTLRKEKELSLMKSRFVSMASHEFRTPLTTILSSVYLLENYKGDQLEKESKKLLERIKRSVHNTIELLNEFLYSGKLEEGKLKPTFSDVNIALFLDELQQEVNLLKKDDQEVKFNWRGEVMVVTDSQILKNLLINLISNSIKYSAPNGCIEIEVEAGDHRITLKVADDGVGIPEEEQKFIFKRFFRGRNVTGTSGTGLGLNIVRKYVKLLGGNIEFSSALHQGTTFVVTLPQPVIENITT